jgi:hypothetical protein
VEQEIIRQEAAKRAGNFMHGIVPEVRLDSQPIFKMSLEILRENRDLILT